jgi:hypothetical protein
MLSDVLPPLANLSRAFQKKDIDFTVVKPLVQGTKATIDALSMTPGEHYQSLPSVLPELRESGKNMPSDLEIDQFKKNMYDKYLSILSDHIRARFPDVALLEGFGIFDPAGLPHELALHATHGQDMLHTLTEHYGKHGIIETDASQVELKDFEQHYCQQCRAQTNDTPSTDVTHTTNRRARADVP